MSFLSPEFAYLALVFFPIYWLLSSRPTLQKLFLLAGSYSLYASWSIKTAIFLGIYSAIIWALGTWVQSGVNTSKRWKLSASFLFALSLLFLTKYYEFFRELLLQLLVQLGLPAFLPAIDVIVPVGISFFTFQAITFVFWKYQSKVKVSLLDLLLYLSFWPTLFAGPIIRAKDFHEQLHGRHFGQPLAAQKAIYFIFLGLFQKMVLATWLATQYVDAVFKYPEEYLAIDTLHAILAYTLQIFLDFSGYTLIVTGFGLLLGFTLPLNFAQPYLANNLREFWQRWHISLSNFIKDFVYIPMGGNRRGFAWSQCNVLIAMVVSGIWHGAGLGFLIWGVIHGLGLVLSNISRQYVPIRLPNFCGQVFTFIFVAFAWVFFKASSVENALSLLSRLNASMGEFKTEWLYLWLFSILFMLLSKYASWLEVQWIDVVRRINFWLLIPVLCALGYLLIELSPEGVPSFIYYQF
ncbi:MBOAT family O-acyltransferase [Polynucleobacter kasalickyi]|uniref:Probable alginate O-acetylase AlgI n=1 Tax=Polynucleobacter kasalickyi TaxID=1938817 RepID=A0A1W1Y2E3_9BURK|nr:MBOAT family O-acyltransferase [Polynucleobacter kasalickyi]SMC30359.1 D-alanyl-lipoteichoic acid acyltransferase DltB, MBOAT superfamily [Polynucleobacter kasalickyi]